MEMKRFLDKLGSSTPTPGGGSASALAAALAASLVAMVAGLSLSERRATRKEMANIRKKALLIQERLFRAVDEDAKAFDAVIKAIRLPKNTVQERLFRERMIQKAYQKAISVPQSVCQCSVRLLEWSEVLISKGNPNAMGDAGVAAYLANSALEGEMLNIRVNLLAIHSSLYRRKMEESMRRMTRRRDRLIKKSFRVIRMKTI